MGDLLPSSAMIKELSQEFGMPMSQEDLTGSCSVILSGISGAVSEELRWTGGTRAAWKPLRTADQVGLPTG